jgi:glycine dehydrogenase
MANASMLDEATAAAEAMTLAKRSSKSKSSVFIVASDCHPQTIEVVQTRAAPLGIEVKVGFAPGLMSEGDFFGVLTQYPCTTGQIADLRAAVQQAHDKQAVFIVAADLLALTLLAPPGEWGADIAVGSTQRFGMPMGNGGPHAAFMACRDEFKRSMPGRLIGVSVDVHGNPAYRLALQTREQHIRREKATSNICTNQALVALMATIFLSVYGKEGIRELAEHNLAKADYAAKTLSAQPGAKLLFTGAPRFHEFVLQTEEAPAQWSQRLLDAEIVGGIDLSRWYPELRNCTLWCATEIITREQIDAAAKALAAVPARA